MANLVSVAKERVRYKLRDRQRGQYLIQNNELVEVIRSTLQRLAPKIVLAKSWVTGGVTITKNSTDFVLPSATTVEYRRVMWLKLTSDGGLLEKWTPEEIERHRSHQSGATGVPSAFCLWEDETGAVRGRLNIPAQANDTADLFRAVSPTDPAEDSDSLPLSRLGMEILADAVCIELLARLPADSWASREVDRDALLAEYRSRLNGMIHDDRVRGRDFKTVGRTMRRFV